MKYHIMYYDEDYNFHSIEKEFSSFAAVEQWLESINATDWQIG